MHPNPIFHTQTETANLAWAASRGAGNLAVNGADGVPLMAHIPFVVEGDRVLFHLVRSNAIARAVRNGLPGKLFVSGPESYISPDWYGIDDQVPTWNYVAVHLAGDIRLLPDADLRGVLDRLSDRFEAELAPKPIWTADKMPEEALTRMMRMIVPCEMRITGVDGTWKLGQNKPDSVRLAAAEAVATHGIGLNVAELAALMRQPPE